MKSGFRKSRTSRGPLRNRCEITSRLLRLVPSPRQGGLVRGDEWQIDLTILPPSPALPPEGWEENGMLSRTESCVACPSRDAQSLRQRLAEQK